MDTYKHRRYLRLLELADAYAVQRKNGEIFFHEREKLADELHKVFYGSTESDGTPARWRTDEVEMSHEHKEGEHVMWRVPMRHGFATEYRGTINALIKLDGMGTFAILRVTDVRCFHVDHPANGRALPPPSDMQAECVSKLVPA